MTMDKVLSARIDEAVVRRIGDLARRLRTSKKDILERAVNLFAESVNKSHATDIFEQTSGAWQRSEGPEKTVTRVRRAFRESLVRHRQ